MTETTETFSPYDSADYLVDVETAAAYLEAALDGAEDDSTATNPSFATIIKVAKALGLKLPFDSVA